MCKKIKAVIRFHLKGFWPPLPNPHHDTPTKQTVKLLFNKSVDFRSHCYHAQKSNFAAFTTLSSVKTVVKTFSEINLVIPFLQIFLLKRLLGMIRKRQYGLFLTTCSFSPFKISYIHDIHTVHLLQFW